MSTDDKISEDIQKSISGLWDKIKKTAEITQKSNSGYNEVSAVLSGLQNSVNQKNSELIQLRQLLEDKEKAEEKLITEKVELQNKFEQISKQFAEYEPVYKERTSLLIINEELSNTNEQLQTQVGTIPNLKQDIEKYLVELSQLTEQAKQDKQKIAELSKIANDFTFAQKEISRKNHEIHEKQNEMQRLKNELAEAQSLIFSLKGKDQELSETKAAYEKLLIDHQAVEQNFKELSSKYENEKIAALNAKYQTDEELKESRHIINAHEQTISDLMGQVLALQSSLQDTENIKNNHKAKIDELDSILLRQSEALTATNTKNLSLEQELNKSSVLNAELNEKIAELSEKVADGELLKEELENLKGKVNQKSQEISELYNEKNSLNSRIEELLQSNSELNSKISEHIETLSIKDDLLYLQEQELEQANKKIETIQAKLTVFQSENLELSEEIEKYSVLKSKFEILEDEFINVKTENENLNEQKRLIANQLTDFEKQVKGNQYEIEVLVKDNNALRNELIKLEDYNSRLINNQTRVEEMTKDLEILSSDNKELRYEIENKCNQIAELNNRIREIAMENEQLTKEKLASQDMIFEMPSNQRIDEFKTNIINLEKMLADKDKVIDKMSKQIDKLKTKVVYAHTPELFPMDNSSKGEMFESEINDLKAVIAEKDKQIEELKVLLENPKDNHIINSQEKIIMDLTSEKTLKELQLTNLQRKNDSLEELLRTRYEHIKILEKEIDAYSNERRTKQAEKSQLIEKIEKVIERLESSN